MTRSLQGWKYEIAADNVHSCKFCQSTLLSIHLGEIAPNLAIAVETGVEKVKHVVIVGGGFAGLNCARKLAERPDVRLTLIDKNNYQQFQPLLYQVATAGLSATNAAFSLRSVLRGHPNVDVKLGTVVSVDPKHARRRYG